VRHVPTGSAIATAESVKPAAIKPNFANNFIVMSPECDLKQNLQLTSVA
jgi:hypothetical protein